jgi:uncharacterized membrane protein
LVRNRGELKRRDWFFKARFITFFVQLGIQLIDLIVMAVVYWPTPEYMDKGFGGGKFKGNPLTARIVSSVISIAIYSIVDLYLTFVTRRFRNLLRK